MKYATDKRAGWDDLYEEHFEDIEKLIVNNLNFIHDEELINSLFFNMNNTLDKAHNRMSNLPGDLVLKEEWFNKLNKIKEYAKRADTPNKKVIAITMIDQFLRATY